LSTFFVFLVASFFGRILAGAGRVRAHRGDGKGTEAGFPDSDRIKSGKLGTHTQRGKKSATELPDA
jgi:hypothetical protein